MKPRIPELIGGGAPLTVSTVRRSGATYIVPVGEIDRETAPRLVDVLNETLASSKRVAIDMSEVHFMDSQGLRVLLEAKIRAGNEREVVISSPSSQVRRLLAMTDLLEFFGLWDAADDS